MTSTLTHPFAALVVGPPGSGKTTTLRWIAYQLLRSQTVSWCIAVTNSKYEGEYSFLDESFVHEEVSDDFLEQIIFLQEQYQRPGLIIFDDVTGAIDFKSKAFKKLFSRHRHLNVTVLVGVHYRPLESARCSSVLWKQVGGASRASESPPHQIIFRPKDNEDLSRPVLESH